MDSGNIEAEAVRTGVSNIEGECNSLTLITANRFDVLAKYLFAKWRDRGIDSEWHKSLYLNHIKVFNGYLETDGSGKRGEKYFLEAFEVLLDSIKSNGFDKGMSRIPIDKYGTIIDGAHRLASSLLYGEKVFVTHKQTVAPVYNYEWFLRRGLNPAWADAIATEVCKLIQDPFIIVLYPAAQGRDEELESLIHEHASIWYKKEVILENQGPINLIRQIYYDEPWVGNWRNGFAGAQNKASWCFPRQGPLRVYLVESALDEMRSLKERIRGLYQVENHSVHINDHKAEALHLAGLLFNANSIEFMNLCNLTEFSWNARLLREYKKWLSTSGCDIDDYCIDGSAVLAVFGIREARDIDFLHSNSAKADTGFKEISSHNHEVHWYGKTSDDIIYNPTNHFYYEGVKFATLPVIQEMKRRRGEAKDCEDDKGDNVCHGSWAHYG